ncbi:unnamed protein product [Linum tenue]|uniref:Rhamnogalacturonan endolyase n=1 Tax=Linum tenue TaxID=586396 RepID=A0AAV0HCQ5_9ROSI|nr:unnamed protein product [Linum tenue]
MGLAPPGAPGSWQRDGKNYQFWNKTNNHGGFSINNVRPGTYSLYGWVPGLLGDYKFHKDVVITPGSHTELGFLVFEPPRNGPTVWEIGVPDRSAAEFFVPEPEPTYINKFDYSKDWYFAQVTREVKDPKSGAIKFQATNWRINFDLQEVDSSGNYTFRMALAAAFD